MNIHNYMMSSSLVCVLVRIFTLLVNALRLDAAGKEVDRDSLLDVVLQFSQLFETFVISSYPNVPPNDGKFTLSPASSLPLSRSFLTRTLSLFQTSRNWSQNYLPYLIT